MAWQEEIHRLVSSRTDFFCGATEARLVVFHLRETNITLGIIVTTTLALALS
jgi:hypothetical protein